MQNEFPELVSSRLRLRQIVSTDIERIFYGLSHPEVIKYYGVSYDSLEATQEQMDWFVGLEREGSGIWWAICAKDSGEFLGGVGFNDLSETHKKAEVGLWLLPEHWGKGYMQEAMPLACNYMFEQRGLHRIEGYVESNNAGCKKALAKLQFEYEGTMKDCEVKYGQFISVDIYAKFKK